MRSRIRNQDGRAALIEHINRRFGAFRVEDGNPLGKCRENLLIVIEDKHVTRLHGTLLCIMHANHTMAFRIRSTVPEHPMIDLDGMGNFLVGVGFLLKDDFGLSVFIRQLFKKLSKSIPFPDGE